MAGKCFRGDEDTNCPEMKTTSDCRFPFCRWSLVLTQHKLNKEDMVSNSGTALTPKVIVFSFLTRAPNLSLSPWESGNK